MSIFDDLEPAKPKPKPLPKEGQGYLTNWRKNFRSPTTCDTCDTGDT